MATVDENGRVLTASDAKTFVPRNKKSQRIGCPFKVTATTLTGDDGSVFWKIHSLSSATEHNHPMARSANSYPMNRRIRTTDQRRQLRQLVQSFANNTTIARKMNADGLGLTPKDVANFKQDMKDLLCGDTEMQNLILQLQDGGYFVAYSVAITSNGKQVLKAIFFAHESRIELAKRFNEVICIDATYKTNRMKLPFVKVVGVNNIGTAKGLSTFGIAGGWITDETRDSYTWFVRNLKNAIWTEEENHPKLFVSDSEQALLEPLSSVFPNSKRSLCHIHVKRNFRTKLQKYFQNYEQMEKAVNFMCCAEVNNPISGLVEAVQDPTVFNIGKTLYEKEAAKS